MLFAQRLQELVKENTYKRPTHISDTTACNSTVDTPPPYFVTNVLLAVFENR